VGQFANHLAVIETPEAAQSKNLSTSSSDESTLPSYFQGLKGS